MSDDRGWLDETYTAIFPLQTVVNPFTWRNHDINAKFKPMPILFFPVFEMIFYDAFFRF